MKNHLLINKTFLGSFVFVIAIYLIHLNIVGFIPYYSIVDNKVKALVFSSESDFTAQNVWGVGVNAGASANASSTNKNTQYVILSFDGSRSIQMWEDSRAFSKEMIQSGSPVHFTYFINTIYLLNKEQAKSAYKPPRSFAGDSKIGYGTTENDIKNRISEINSAYAEGHEIASHAVGHFNGAKWSEEEWDSELNSFSSIVNNAGLTFNSSVINGFRAPELGVNSNLYKSLAKNKYTYDSSGTMLPGKFPYKDENGIWHIGIGAIAVKKERTNDEGITASSYYGNRYVLSMDYNFWTMQSSGKNIVKKGSPLWNDFLNEMKSAYLGYFNKVYSGNRAPVVIGHHFSKWNDGVYWEAMKAFAKEVCGKPDVKCVTFKEYVGYLNSVQK